MQYIGLLIIIITIIIRYQISEITSYVVKHCELSLLTEQEASIFRIKEMRHTAEGQAASGESRPQPTSAAEPHGSQ